MASRISLSRRDAEAIASLVETRHPGWLANQQDAIDRLRAALAPKPKRTAAKKERRARVASKRAAKREETAAIYAAAEARAAGKCEACGEWFWDGDPAELDHALGRGRYRQSISNCWLLHRSCHRRKTDNMPSAAAWLFRLEDHFTRHEYRVEADIVRGRLAASEALSRASAISEGRGR